MAEHERKIRRFSDDKKRVSTPILILGFVVVAGIGYVAGAFNSHIYGGYNTIIGKSQLELSSVQATYQAVLDNFDGDIDESKLVEGANRGLVEALDDQYTIYLNQKDSTDFNDSLSGNIGGGVGIEISLRGDLPTIVRVLRDNPAEKAGLAVNDILTAVNGEDVKDQTTTEIVTKIRGDAGTTVKLTVFRDGVEKDFTVTREVVNNPSVYGSVVDGVGVMTISRFDDKTGDLARKLAREFKTAGAKGVVLDLRGNGGGYVTAAQDVGGIWLDNKVVVTEKKGSKVTDELKTGGSPILNGVPTVVLINSSSASASEIVAGALRDNKAATLLGEKSFGKGSVQKLVGLSEGATLKVTVARWYTPSGLNISEKGITPDTTVVRTVEDLNASRDPQLDAAKAALL